MAVPAAICELVERYRDNRDEYRSAGYKEFRLRKEFVDPFFEALGWDVSNRSGYAEAYKDVVHEDSIKIAKSSKAPDYAFRVGGTRKFFVEAKAPLVNIKDDISPAYQLRRYGWSSKLPISILTDFEEFAVYDCRIQPKPNDTARKARLLYLTYADYEDQWDAIANVFSRDAILKGSFDRYAIKQTGRRGTDTVDDSFLSEIESWRALLASEIHAKNPSVGVDELGREPINGIPLAA
jgi:predicted type IV restriction endonuclease